VEGILEEIIHPSRVISDQYSSSEVVLDDGETITGLVARREDSVRVYTRDLDAEPTVVSRDAVQTIRQVDVSQMPAGLINSLNPEELRDLMAYMLSGGNPDADLYGSDEEEATEAEEDAEESD
jgi:putative heme-binding domain-containing protein